MRNGHTLLDIFWAVQQVAPSFEIRVDEVTAEGSRFVC